jgi:methylmalonyl-CoA mutase C-terminal domain/subunit
MGEAEEVGAAAPIRRIRVLVAKPGLDGHDRGAKIIAHALKDAGMEVIYTGLRQTPEQIASAAIQEDVGVVCLSILSGAHMTLAPRTIDLLRAGGAGEILILAGGTIPRSDIPALIAAGIAAVFTPGTDPRDVVTYIREHAPARS